MAKAPQGLFGPLTGKIGNVVKGGAGVSCLSGLCGSGQVPPGQQQVFGKGIGS